MSIFNTGALFPRLYIYEINLMIGCENNNSLLALANRSEHNNANITDMHKTMHRQLEFVELLDVSCIGIGMTFRVDTFTGRVHTPVVETKICTTKVRLRGSPVVSIGVEWMTDLILGGILYAAVGRNDFSDAVDRGERIYDVLRETVDCMRTARPCDVLQEAGLTVKWCRGGPVYGDPAVGWLYIYMTRGNLERLIQYIEVRIMRGLWQKLVAADIPFLTIHDRILVNSTYRARALTMMGKELALHFKTFTIDVADEDGRVRSIDFSDAVSVVKGVMEVPHTVRLT